MATTITRYVNTASSAGGDGTTNATSGSTRAYATLAAAIAAEVSARPNLVTNDELLQILCCGTAADSSQVEVSGFTTDVDRYISIEGNTGDPNGRHAGVWSTSHYRLEVSVAFNRAIRVVSDFVRVVGIQIRQTNTATDAYDAIIFQSGGGSAQGLIDSCIVRNASTSATNGNGIRTASWPGSLTVRNTIVYDVARYGILASAGFSGSPAINIDNCTVIGGALYGIHRADIETMTVRNTYAHGTTDAFNGTMTRSTCAHSSATSFSGSTASVAHSSANFVSVTGGSEDYHLASGASATLLTGGADLSGSFTEDIDRQTRSAWSIGADEPNSGATPHGPFGLALHGPFGRVFG